ncbi:MAG: AraC family ligand binding domain-containing protein, partial [Bacillota bacterium]
MKYLEQRETRAHGTFDFPFGYYNIKSNHPRYHMVDHRHTEYEIIRISKGEFHFILNGHKHIGNAGDIFIVPDGALHGGTPRKCHYECLVFYFHSVIELSPMCKQLAQPVLFGSSQFINHITNCDEGLRLAADKLFSSLACEKTYAPFQVISATFDFVGRLLEQYTEDCIEKSKDAAMRSVSRIKDVLRLIRNHYHEEITLDDLANGAHMNKRYFCR